MLGFSLKGLLSQFMREWDENINETLKENAKLPVAHSSVGRRDPRKLCRDLHPQMARANY
jgi:hypothetical protein